MLDVLRRHCPNRRLLSNAVSHPASPYSAPLLARYPWRARKPRQPISRRLAIAGAAVGGRRRRGPACQQPRRALASTTQRPSPVCCRTRGRRARPTTHELWRRDFPQKAYSASSASRPTTRELTRSAVNRMAAPPPSGAGATLAERKTSAGRLQDCHPQACYQHGNALLIS
jgi:hypothetical protein